MGNTTQKAVKRERTSFAASRRKLDGVVVIPQVEKNYFLRWFNDVDNKLQRATDAAFEFVLAKEIVGRVGDKEVHGDNSDLNSRVSRKTRLGDIEITVYLMKQPNEFHKEDMEEKEAKNALVDDAIRAGTSGGATIGNQYGDVKLR